METDFVENSEMRSVMTMRNRLISNSAVLISSSALNRCLGALFSIVVARLLKVDNFGTYSIIMTFCVIGEFLSDLNLSQFAVREFPRNQKDPGGLLSRIISLRLIFALFVYCSLQIAVRIIGYEPLVQTCVSIVTLSLFFQALGGSLGTVFIAKEEPMVPSLISFFFAGIYTAVSIGLLLKGSSLVSIFWTKLIVNVVAAACMYAVFSRRFHWPLVKPKLRSILDLVGQASPFFTIGLLGLLQYHTDILFLSKLSPMPRNAQAGYFSAARGILSPIHILSQGVAVALLPRISKRMQSQNDLRYVRKLVQRISFGLFALGGVPLLIFAFYFGEWGIKTVLGTEFLPALRTAQVLSVAYAIELFFAPMTDTLLCSPRLSRYVGFYGCIVFAKVIISILLIPIYGHFGAACSTLFAPVAGTVLVLWVSRIELQ